MAGKSNRDRGRRTERRHPHTPTEAAVERVDAHTAIVRAPQPLSDLDLDALRVYLSSLEPPRTDLRPTAGGVWLTPGEVAAMEEVPLPGLEGDD